MRDKNGRDIAEQFYRGDEGFTKKILFFVKKADDSYKITSELTEDTCYEELSREIARKLVPINDPKQYLGRIEKRVGFMRRVLKEGR